MTSSDAPVKGFQLKDISPRAWQHPADRAATAALGSIPYLDTVVRTLIQLGYENALRQASLGASVRLGENQLPEVWSDHVFAYSTLDMEPVPSLYVTQNPFANAFAIGAKDPIVVINSELLQLLDAPQRRAVFAHEAAHILSDHQLYRTALLILLRLTATAKIALPLIPVRTALMEWYRATELSCDRAAAIVSRDPLAVCKTLMAISAGAMTDQLELDAFMAQSMEYAEQGGGLERLTRLMLDLGVSHPLPVRRTRELMLWVRSGDFDRIVGGDYLRRDDPVSVRAEAGEAVSFYSDRFKEAFKDAGETIGQGGQQLADWLRKAKDDLGGRGDDGDEDA
ncbi:M48 family metallopeptidase [Conexibacter sp. JD483]|uniref:M48 family metallopeptidase n=1 Tax=unclassified Conexibacter TaxID=2627773 RepID=UPI00271F5909|nr:MULTISPECIES: M48 family metallopeptidase [unclassified Conexibacter]MDO8186278.1 M48 family metallopeptidase [Conexibacter sp. CPCC 205706]MDO8197483.1 M48 family metallopeptidase [Conexibacter sp. CPCC 205762]MDR9370266.1 M48 family metallopeptidase [Conexibacter sp. JD483]